MRRLAAVLTGCLLLTGCSSSWQDQLRYKVVEVDNSTPSEMLKLELVGEAPKDALWQDGLTPQFKLPSSISGGAAVGDEVVCTAKQKEGSPFASWNKDTELTGCKKA